MMNFIENAKGLTRNPLGIIALFVSLIYGFACLVLSTSISNLKEQEERLPLIWFIIVFPLVILVGFIFLVTKHHGKLYSPGDYGNAESFLKTIEGAKKIQPAEIQVNQENYKDVKNFSDVVRKAEGKNFNKTPFLPETKKHLALANASSDQLNKRLKKFFEKGFLTQFSYGIVAPEYFLMTYSISKKITKLENLKLDHSIIIRVTDDDNGDLNLIAIGKDIIEKDPEVFAKRIFDYIDDQIDKIQDKTNS